MPVKPLVFIGERHYSIVYVARQHAFLKTCVKIVLVSRKTTRISLRLPRQAAESVPRAKRVPSHPGSRARARVWTAAASAPLWSVCSPVVRLPVAVPRAPMVAVVALRPVRLVARRSAAKADAQRSAGAAESAPRASRVPILRFPACAPAFGQRRLQHRFGPCALSLCAFQLQIPGLGSFRHPDSKGSRQLAKFADPLFRHSDFGPRILRSPLRNPRLEVRPSQAKSDLSNL